MEFGMDRKRDRRRKKTRQDSNRFLCSDKKGAQNNKAHYIFIVFPLTSLELDGLMGIMGWCMLFPCFPPSYSFSLLSLAFFQTLPFHYCFLLLRWPWPCLVLLEIPQKNNQVKKYLKALYQAKNNKQNELNNCSSIFLNWNNLIQTKEPIKFFDSCHKLRASAVKN